jgi:enoyl-CoA hydratase/carnithine racemase
MRYILSGDFFDAKKAYEMNVVSELTDDENLHDAVIKFAKNIAQKSLHNLVLARKSVNAADELSLS